MTHTIFEIPFALSIGPQRCGTGWLERYMRRRGDICLPESVKEIFFFDRHYHRGPEFYLSHFHPLDKHILAMELTTTAFDVPDAPRNAYNLLGKEIKLACLLRHPVDRALAVYHDYLHYGIVSGPIAEAVDQAPQILFGSRYADHLERWFERFGEQQVEIFLYETLEKDPAAFARQVCDFLALSFIPPAADIHLTPMHNLSPAKPRLGAILEGFVGANKKGGKEGRRDTPDIRWLAERLSGEQERLEKLIGRVIPHWRS